MFRCIFFSSTCVSFLQRDSLKTLAVDLLLLFFCQVRCRGKDSNNKKVFFFYVVERNGTTGKPLGGKKTFVIPSPTIFFLSRTCIQTCASIHLKFKLFRHFFSSLLCNETHFLLQFHTHLFKCETSKSKEQKSKSRLGNLTMCACQAICVCARNNIHVLLLFAFISLLPGWILCWLQCDCIPADQRPPIF